jgi:hypothetical protein
LPEGGEKMNAKEKRKFERIPNNDLPIRFQNLYADVGIYKHLNAETLDVSTTGVGVNLYLPEKALRSLHQITLYSENNQYEFSGQIVNVQKLHEDYYRVGIVLQ